MVDLNFNVDMDALGEITGTIAGMEEAFSDKNYLDNLVHSAHNKASEAFDMAAAATAGAGYLTHMYEYGVNGITRGDRGPGDPTSVAARLWVHELSGTQGDYQIAFNYRPAVVPNPKPATSWTGVKSKYLRKISKRRYFFRHKAMVMESGMEVSLLPKRGRFLFVPFYGEESRNPKNNKGFMMWNAEMHGSIDHVPGAATQGTFTKFWMGWWEGTGMELMQKSVEADVTYDVTLALKEAEKNAAKIAPVPVVASAANVEKTRAVAQKRTSSKMKSKSASRRGMDRK